MRPGACDEGAGVCVCGAAVRAARGERAAWGTVEWLQPCQGMCVKARKGALAARREREEEERARARE